MKREAAAVSSKLYRSSTEVLAASSAAPGDDFEKDESEDGRLDRYFQEPEALHAPLHEDTHLIQIPEETPGKENLKSEEKLEQDPNKPVSLLAEREAIPAPFMVEENSVSEKVLSIVPISDRYPADKVESEKQSIENDLIREHSLQVNVEDYLLGGAHPRTDLDQQAHSEEDLKSPNMAPGNPHGSFERERQGGS